MIRIAVLALQGAFGEHTAMVEKLGAVAFEVRKKADLSRDFDGLILPGGESTVIGSLLKDLGLFDRLKDDIENGLPVFGTCAGLILLAKELQNGDAPHLATMDIEVIRNGYGRQLGSFHTSAPFLGRELGMTFIRAPYINKAGRGVTVLAAVDRRIVAARQGRQLVTAFHPELGDDLRVHRYFLDMIEKTA